MSSNCSTCSKVTLDCVVWNAGRAVGGALGRRAASTAEAVRGRVALTCHQCGAAGSAGAGGKRAREGEGFLLGQEGEKPTWDRSGRGNIMCSHTH